MTCSQVREMAGAYALDALTRHDRQRVDRHLMRCGRCRREVAALSEAASSLGSLVPPAEPPPELRERILAAAQRPVRTSSSTGRQALPGPRPLPASRQAGGRRPRLGYVMAYGAAAAIFFAAGWAVGRLDPSGASGGYAQLQRELMAKSLQEELWRAVASPQSEVLPLQVETVLNRALAFVAISGTSSTCRLQVLASGVAPPPRGFRYEGWVWLRDGSARRVGFLEPVGPQRWELTAVVPVAAREVQSLQIFLEQAPAQTGAGMPSAAQGAGALPPGQTPTGRKVMWGQLWAAEGGEEW